MFDFIRKALFHKNIVTPGTYDSKVKSVRWAKDYPQGCAFKIKYNLILKNGKKATYSEIIFNPEIFNKYERGKRFLDYLLSNGLTDLSEFKGCHEILTLKEIVIDHRTHIVIDERKFIGRGNKGA